jgi:hypothetical protein
VKIRQLQWRFMLLPACEFRDVAPCLAEPHSRQAAPLPQQAKDTMKRHLRITPRPMKRYVVVVAITLIPLLWNFAQYRLDEGTTPDSVFAAGAPSAAPDSALLLTSDVERALPVPPRAVPESLAHTTL